MNKKRKEKKELTIKKRKEKKELTIKKERKKKKKIDKLWGKLWRFVKLKKKRKKDLTEVY